VCIQASDLCWLLAGYAVSLGGGGLLLPLLSAWLDKKLDLDLEYRDEAALRPWIVGLAERFFFTTGFAVSPGAAFGLAGAWIVAKMAANWMDRDATRWVRGHRMRALVLNLTSMSLALLGGLTIRAGVY
jgi:hypothetical protein